jgi:NSS family neurotransmitter:Na+ symporter
LIAWIFNLAALRNYINGISSIKLGKSWVIMVKFIAPAALIMILLYDLYNEIDHPYGDYSRMALGLIGILWLLVTLLAGFMLAMLPWKTGLLNQPGRSK